MLKLFLMFALATVIAVPSAGRADPPPVQDYGKLPGMDMVRLSPSGQRYAFIADDGVARRLYVATTDNKPIQMVNVGNVKVVSLRWAGEDFLLIEYSQTVDVGWEFIVHKKELTGVKVLNLRTHKLIQIFGDKPNIENVVDDIYGTAQIKGRWYGYFGGFSLVADLYKEWVESNIQSDGAGSWIAADLYRVDLESGVPSLVAKGDGRDQSWLIGPGGDIVARSYYTPSTGDWKVMGGVVGGRELASGQDQLSGPDFLGFSRGEDAILISLGNDEDEVTEEVPLAGGPAKIVIPAGTAASPLHDPLSKLWIGSRVDGDEPSETFFSPIFDARMRGVRKAFPDHQVSLMSWNDAFDRMIVFTQGADDPGGYWIVDINNHSADPLGQVYPTVTDKDVGPVRMIDYKAADGLDLRGVLTLPPGRDAKNLPVVVMPHGGPWARDYPHFDYWSQAFASRGYAVFQPNFRASTGYGDKLYKAGYGELGRKMQTDVSDGLAELVREGIVDPKRACIAGWSYGGYAALAGVTLQHGLYRCAVSMAGVSDMSKQLKYTEDEVGVDSPGTRTWKLFLGVQTDWSALNAISPVKLAARADAPILLIHGTDDTVVPIVQSDDMEKALKAANKPVERVTLKNADHWLLRQETRVAMLKASVAFVQKYNPADPAPQAVAASGH